MSAFYLQIQKSFVPKQIWGQLLMETLKFKFFITWHMLLLATLLYLKFVNFMNKYSLLPPYVNGPRAILLKPWFMSLSGRSNGNDTIYPSVLYLSDFFFCKKTSFLSVISSYTLQVLKYFRLMYQSRQIRYEIKSFLKCTESILQSI